MKRYEMIEKVRGMESSHELHSDPDGDWVRYEDVAKLEEAARRVIFECHENQRLGVVTSQAWIEQTLKEALKEDK